MTNEQIKNQILTRLRARAGDAYVEANAKFIEAQWQYAVEVGMLDPEIDGKADPQNPVRTP